MNKIQRRLALQQQQYDQLDANKQRHKQQVDQLYATLREWLVDYLSPREMAPASAYKEMLLSLGEHTSVILRFYPELHRARPFSTVLLTLFDANTPKQQAQCLLYWQETAGQWRIRFLKRKHRYFWLRSRYFRRVWSPAFLESYLMDFIEIPRA